MHAIRILIVDDHSLVRAGISALLRNTPGIEVLAEASSGKEALRLLRRQGVDLVLMDIAMTGMNGLETTKRILAEFPQVRVVILSMLGGEEAVWGALNAGAAGYVIKGASPNELEMAIRTVANGGIYVAPSVRASPPVVSIDQQASYNALARLTPRQRQILKLIGEGFSPSSIAEKLHLSVKTVDTHRAHIMRRLQIHDTAGLVRFAIRNGITSS